MEFNQQLAIQGAQAIYALYRGGIKPTISEPSTDTQVLITGADDVTWVVFPGTDSATDRRTDAKIGKTAWVDERGKVHSGFNAAWRSVVPQMFKQLKGARRVVLFGHSLGGALAMLGADFLQAAQYDIAGVYTFGQPRTGNGSFTRAYNASLNDVTFRVVNERDPVPYVPLWLFGYRHAGREVYLNDNGRIQIERSLFSQLTDAAQRTATGFQSKGTSELASIGAHAITSYLTKLKQGIQDA